MAQNMGEVIRRLRRERNLTQEELAEQIGVTSQAVSKWENNTGLPDISQVVPLANFFGVSTDTLFDFCSEDKQREIEEYLNRTRKLRHNGQNKEDLALWREALGKYPGDYTCMSNLSHALYSCASHEPDKKTCEAYIKEGIALSERILAGCTDSDLRSGAIQLLVLSYGNGSLSFADEEKAVSYANMGGSLYTCSEILLEHAYFTDEGKKEAARRMDSNLLTYMDLLTTGLTSRRSGSKEEQILFCRTAVTLWETLIPDGNFLFYHCRMYGLYARIAYLSARLGRREDTLDALPKARYHAMRYDAIPSGKIYFTSPFVSHASSTAEYSTKNYQETEHELFLRELEDPCYDFLRDDPEFLRLAE